MNLGVDDYRNCNAEILWYLNVLLLTVSAFHIVLNFHTVKMLTLLIHSGYLGVSIIHLTDMGCRMFNIHM